MHLISLFISSMLIENIVLTKFLGMCPFIGTSTSTKNAIGMGISVTIVTVLASILSYLIYYFILVPTNSTYLTNTIFIFLIASLVGVLEIIIKNKHYKLYKALGIYLPLITTNCAVLGIVLLNINNNYNRNYLKEPNFKYEEIDAPYMPYPSEFMSDIKILEKQFKQLLKNDDEFVKKQKRGRIDSSSLWKMNTIYDNNIFIKKTIQNESDYGIYILIDLSGSMDGGDKYKQAITTALKIEGALANLSGVKVKTVGFDYTNRSRLRVFKNFNDKKTKTPNALYNSYIGSSNRDGFAIRVALEDLKRINCKNKLLVVISDGRPAWEGESIAEAMLDVKKAVHEGRKESMIMSVLINNGRIFDNIKESFHYMYEDKGTIMVDIDKEPEILLGSIVYYLKKLFKKR